jgi:hypothetical protein
VIWVFWRWLPALRWVKTYGWLEREEFRFEYHERMQNTLLPDSRSASSKTSLLSLAESKPVSPHRLLFFPVWWWWCAERGEARSPLPLPCVVVVVVVALLSCLLSLSLS